MDHRPWTMDFYRQFSEKKGYKYSISVHSFSRYLPKLIRMIKMSVIGNLGKDALVNNVNGKNVINFTVAHTEKFKDAQGNQKDKTIWVDCAYWTDRTAVAPYLKKGTQVYVDGQPDVRTYTTQDGRNGATLSLRVASVQLLGTKGNDGGNSNEGGGNNYQSAPPASVSALSAGELTEPLDDLPF